MHAPWLSCLHAHIRDASVLLMSLMAITPSASAVLRKSAAEEDSSS